MKSLLFFGVVGIAIVVFAEYCPNGHDDDCTLTVCDNNTVIDCHEHQDLGVHICTCIPNVPHSCTGSPNIHDQHNHECEQWGHCHSHGRHWHCIQGTCRCFGKFDNPDGH